jgi:anti-sigma regulatory factor (Ser/Thr protein kinase)
MTTSTVSGGWTAPWDAAAGTDPALAQAALYGLSENHLRAVQTVCAELVANAYDPGARPHQIRLRHTALCCVHIEVDDASHET